MLSIWDKTSDRVELEEKALQLAEQIADLVSEIFGIDITEGEHDASIYLQEFLDSLTREVQDECFDDEVIRE